MKRHKDPVNDSTRNGDAQVFVLPPDLLEQLGIQLSGLAPGEFTEHSVVGQSNNTDDIPSSVNEPSILETANLMKQSVFMSPTFTSTIATETTSDLQVPNIVRETDISIQEANDFVVKDVAETHYANTIELNRADNTNDDETPKDSVKYESIKEYEVENGDLILTNISHETQNNANIILDDKTPSIDDHADEAYASDGSNSSPRTCSEITNNNAEIPLKQQTASNKIKILSEQIINHSDFNSIQSSCIQKSSNACFLIPVNTIITGKAAKLRSDTCVELETAQEKLCATSDTNTNNNIEKAKSADEANHLNTVVNKDAVVEDSLTVTYSGLIESGSIEDETEHKVKTGDHSNIGSEVLNIDIPLNDIEDKMNVSKDDSKDEIFKLNTINDAAKEIISNTGKNSSKSKLCIQGVEKPGGKYENKRNNVIKTYKRLNIQKRIPDFPQIDNDKTEDLNILPKDIVIDLDDINIGGYKNANKFCICKDFGQLANYDSDIDYVHLHFCDHNSVSCNLETLFSMYDDNSASRDYNITNTIDEVDDKGTTQYNICWMSFTSEDNGETEELAIAGQLRRSNRKRKSTMSEQVTDIAPRSKNTVKCGVCYCTVPEAEWNKHKDSEHNSIAWEEGQTIDLKNKRLLRKLGLKMKKLGVLKCTFCKKDIKYLDKFIQHVKACIKRKVENVSNTTDSGTQKKNTSSKSTQPSRRSSRNLNLEIEVSMDCTKTKVNLVEATSKNINTRTSIDTKNQCKSEEVSVSKRNETSTSKIKANETASKLIKKNDGTSKSPGKPADVVPPKPTRKTSGPEDTRKSNKMSTSTISSSKPIVKSLDVETPVTRRSKSVEDTLKYTNEEITTKSKRKTLDVVTKPTGTQDSTSAHDKSIPKIIRPKKDDLSKVDILKPEPTVSPKSTKIATEIHAKLTETKNTPKSDMDVTIKSKRMSSDFSSKTTDVTETPKSSRRSINVEDTSKSNSAQKNDVGLKTNRKSVDYAGYPKPNSTSENTQGFSKNSFNTSTHSESVDHPNKSPTKRAETVVRVTDKSILNPIIADPISKRKLKEVDLFSSPTVKKIAKVENQPKSIKQSKEVTASSRPANIESTLKSSSSLDASSKRSRKSEESDKEKRKSTDAEANRKPIEAAKSTSKSADLPVSSKSPRQYHSRNKGSVKSGEVSTSKETENVNTPLETKSQPPAPKSKRKCSDMTQSETISTENDTKSQKWSNVMNIKMSLVDSPQESVSVEIEVPAQSTETAAVDKITESITREKVVASANSKNVKANSSTKINSKNPPADEIISIKQEVIPKCGVCNQPVEDSQWLEHIAKEHDYLAWREGDSPLDLNNEEEIRAHLYPIAKVNGGLKCSKCNLTRKYVKSFLTHIRSCQGYDEEESEIDASTGSVDMNTTLDHDSLPLKTYSRIVNSKPATPVLPQRSIECGVCSETVLENKWIDHIRMEHKYLAWKKGDPPLNVKDEVAVKNFLQNISKYSGGLICSKCGATRSYVKKWMDHEASCRGKDDNESSLNTTTENAASKESSVFIEIEMLDKIVKCGKCGKEVPSKTWMDHIEKEHNYLSWIEGQTPLNESDPEAVSAYLHALVKKRGSLYCVKCGVTRKYPKAFLTHVSACETSGFKREDYYVAVSGHAKPGEYECAVCHGTGNLKDWKKHAMGKHYNVAWMAGDIPINLKNPYAVEKYIKEYRARYNLVCKVCGASRASCYGFYAHIMTCGKSDEELEPLMEMCNICNNKYLCIYRNQHKAMHKEQMIKKEKKERDALKAEEEILAKAKEKLVEGEPTGKRRAAEKAKKVMEKYTSNIQEGNHMCLSCHIEFDNDTQLKDHECRSKPDDGSDTDVSVKIEAQEESDDDDMEGVDSNISDEENDSLRRKKHTETIPKIVLPFKVKDFSYYLAKSFENFCELHYTSERLFDKWQRDDFNVLSEEEKAIYLPSLLESCKLRIIDDQWDTFKRFETQGKKDLTIFTGASIRCMQWVPHRLTTEPQDHYLSVACYRDADCPRYGKDVLPQHPGMLQLWNMGLFTSTPRFEMGIAHDFGTVWAMDWCPSGARDEQTETEDSRLGLLAIACSNGGAYILSVPRFHSQTQDETIIFKLKPVAELRLSVKPKQPPFRLGYQATSISWSPQKGHDVVMVGYADGTTALYDLNTESSILKSTENGVDIYYPFQDALTENSTITGVSLCASADLRRAVCGMASSSVTGATMASWPRGPSVRSHLAASSVSYTPNWPAALLCSDDVLTVKSTNEMEWWGGGRRLGGACAAGGCARCGRVCLTAPPFVRILRAHPVYPELKKQIVATMKMVPIACKRKLKPAKDNLGMIVEPLTYDETIKKYGLEFKILPKKDQNVASKLCDNAEQCAERFPLSDMPAAAFCPSAEHHHRLAVASHSGFLFIIST